MLGFRFAAVTELFLRQLSLKVGIEGWKLLEGLQSTACQLDVQVEDVLLVIEQCTLGR